MRGARAAVAAVSSTATATARIMCFSVQWVRGALWSGADGDLGPTALWARALLTQGEAVAGCCASGRFDRRLASATVIAAGDGEVRRVGGLLLVDAGAGGERGAGLTSAAASPSLTSPLTST